MLNRLCDDVINMKTTCEELIDEEEQVVSSTEVTPVKLSPPTKRKGSSSSARMLKVSKQLKEAEILSDVAKAASIQSASKRAQHLFGNSSKTKRAKVDELITSESDEESDDLELKGSEAQKDIEFSSKFAKPAATTKKAKKHSKCFSKARIEELSASDSEEEIMPTGIPQRSSTELHKALDEISWLKGQLEESVRSGMSTVQMCMCV